MDESLELNNDAGAFQSVLVGPAYTDVEAGGVGAPVGGAIRRGKRLVVPVTVRNNGNVTYRGPVNIDLFAAGSVLSGPYVRLGTGTVQKRVTVRPNGTKVVRVAVLVGTDLAPGEYVFKVNVNVPPASALGPDDLTHAVFGGPRYTVV